MTCFFFIHGGCRWLHYWCQTCPDNELLGCGQQKVKHLWSDDIERDAD